MVKEEVKKKSKKSNKKIDANNNEHQIVKKPTKREKIVEFIKNVADKAYNTRYCVLFFFAIIFLKTMLFSQDTVFWQDTIWLWYVRQTTSFIIIMVAPMLLFRNSKHRFWYGIVLDLFISILLFADELYYIYARNIVSVMQAGNLQYKDEIIAALPSLFRVRQVLFFIDFPIILYSIFAKKIELKKTVNFKVIPVAILTGVIIFLCTSYHFIPESLELVTGYIYNKKNSVRYGTVYGFHVVDVYNAILHNKDAKYNSYDEMINEYNQFNNSKKELNPDNINFDNIADGKNVIVLQLESIQNFVYGRTINDKEITPNLNKWLNENIYVSNMHATSYTTTSDSEHSVIASLYPLENGEAFSKYYGNTYDDIFKVFKQKDYYTMYAHGNYAYFWNRKNVTSKLNIDNKHFLEDFEDRSELIRTYLSDELLYRQTVGYFEEAIKSQENNVFYDIVAASSHKPFELSGIIDKYSKVNIDVGELKGTPFGNYLEAVNYADYAFGIFIDLLKEKGLYDDTVIIVFGDHYGVTMYDEDFIQFLGYEKDNYNDARMQFEFSNVLCGMKIPGVDPCVIDEPVSKADIKPTLAQIFGLKDEFSIGTSIFSRKSYAAINTGVVITKDYYYTGTEWYRLDNGEKLDMESLSESEQKKLKKYVKEALKEIEISKSVVVNNLLQGIDY